MTRDLLARDLAVGDYLITAIGTAPVLSITPEYGGLAVHLDIRHARSTRPKSETSTLWLYPGERIAIHSRDRAPPTNARRKQGKRDGSPFVRRATGQGSRAGEGSRR